MRKWLKDQCAAQKLDTQGDGDREKVRHIYESVVRKAEFLVKLERPAHF